MSIRSEFLVSLILPVILAAFAFSPVLCAAENGDANQATYAISKVAALSSLSPTVAYDNLLSADDELKVRWSLPIAGATIKRVVVPPKAANVKFLLVETDQHDLIALRRDNGQALWWVKLTHEIYGNVFVGGYSVMFVSNGRIIRLEKMSGDIVWNINLPFAPSAGPVAIDEAETGVMVIMPGLDRITYGFDVQSELWPPKNGIDGLKRNDFQVNLKHLRILWRYQTDGIITNPYLLYNDRVFSGSWTNEVYGISLDGAAENGSPEGVWEFRTRRGCRATPVGDGPYIYVSSLDNTLYCLDSTGGSKVWRYIADDSLYSSAQLFRDEARDESVVVQKVGTGGELIALNIASGKPLWSHKTGKGIVGVLDVENEDVKLRRIAITSDEDGYLSALAPFAPDTRSKEQKEADYKEDILAPAKVLWRVKADKFSGFADNTYDSMVFGISADKRAVVALEEN